MNKTENNEKKIGNIYGYTGGNFAGNIYDSNYISPVILTCRGAKTAYDNRKGE